MFPYKPVRWSWPTLAVVIGISCFFLLGPVLFTVLLYTSFTSFWWLPAGLFAWYLYDHQTPSIGGRRLVSARTLPLWRYFRDYFPINLIKTCNLDCSRNYLFCCHPHGVFCMSHFVNFATEATEFQKLFPGLTPYFIAENSLFHLPVLRECLLSLGSCSCNESSLKFLLSERGVGNAVCLPIGAALEVLEAQPDSFTLVVAKRRGFIRLAMQTGCSLVPVFSFGENNLFCQTRNEGGSFLRQLQLFVIKRMRAAPVMFRGKFGPIPHNHPVHTVVGEPINVPLIDNPSEADLQKFHSLYIDALKHLFESNKQKYGIPPEKHLKFI